jgi:hypothetical protein
MHTAPFWRTADKLGYVLGTLVIFSFAFMLGKYPHDLFYTYYTVLIVGLLLMRLVHFFSVGWQYYLIDFCYYANFMVIYSITLGKD